MIQVHILQDLENVRGGSMTGLKVLYAYCQFNNIFNNNLITYTI